MAIYIFACPCCEERHILNLAISFEPTGNVDPEDWEAFVRVANKVQPKFQESEKFKLWQEAMA